MWRLFHRVNHSITATARPPQLDNNSTTITHLFALILTEQPAGRLGQQQKTQELQQRRDGAYA